MEHTRPTQFVLVLLLSLSFGWGVLANHLYLCRGNVAGPAAVQSGENLTVSYQAGIGYYFHANPPAPTPNPASGGPRGLLILPEDGVPPEAYASYARSILDFQDDYFAVVLEDPTAGNVIKAIMQHPLTEFWSLAGHGSGGVLAAEMTLALQPKVKSLVLIGAALPAHVDLRSANVFVGVLYFGKDDVVSPESVIDSFSLMPGDATIQFLPNLNHYDFADLSSEQDRHSCKDYISSAGGVSDSVRNGISTLLLYSLALAHWPAASEKALSYGDNTKLTPGHNDSKPYPGETRVHFEAVAFPGSNPQRMLWVFVPSLVKGGLIYLAGAPVDERAYWPLAFEIAARGHLVVIPQVPSRAAVAVDTDVNVILDSDLSPFSKVPKGKWAIGGHSAGTFGASGFAASFGERVYAMVLHSGGWAQNMTDSPIPAISLYGTLDSMMGNYDMYRIFSLEYANLEVTTFCPIPGGNHGQVGDYGAQKGDTVATISLEEQHRFLAEKSVEFLDRVGGRSLVESIMHSVSMWLAA